jgi:hypothetical protein
MLKKQKTVFSDKGIEHSVQLSEQPTITNGGITILLDKVVDTIVEDFEKDSDNWQIEFEKLSPEFTYYNYVTTERRYTVSRFQYNADDKIHVLVMNDNILTLAQQDRIRKAIINWQRKCDETRKDYRTNQAVESLKTIFPNSVVPNYGQQR